MLSFCVPLDKSVNYAIVCSAMKIRTKQVILKEFNQSLEDSPDVTEIAFKRLMLEILVDLRDIVQERKNV